jgi:hypothetical protein
MSQTACQTLRLQRFKWTEHLLRLFLGQSECAANLRRLLPHRSKVASLAEMFVDNLLILRRGGVEVGESLLLPSLSCQSNHVVDLCVSALGIVVVGVPSFIVHVQKKRREITPKV